MKLLNTNCHSAFEFQLNDGQRLKMGVQYKTQGNLIIGLERMQFANWLNDSLNAYAGPAEYYTVAASFGF